MSQELPKLQQNKSLRELDLRLNPVSQRGGMHYRLTLVHLVPGLRRLDDVDVKDTERSQCGFLKTCLGYKFPFFNVYDAYIEALHRDDLAGAALKYFTTDQAYEMRQPCR